MAFTNASPSKYGHLVHVETGPAAGALRWRLWALREARWAESWSPPALLSVELLEGAGEAGQGLQSVSWMYYCKVCILYVYLRARAGNEPHVCL